MPTPRGNWYALDLSLKEDEADLADGDVVVVGAAVPWAGEVKEIWAGLSIAPTTGTLAVTKQATTPVTLLNAANVSLASTTIFPAADVLLHTAQKLTLSSSVAALTVAAGNILTATWTLTDITVAGADDLFCCTVLIEPAKW